MTKNKKKLRRVERRYSVTKSAQTLVLAGMLLAGGVTGAMAATWDGPTVTINGAQTETTLITINPNVTGSHAQNINTTVLKIVDGGTLTLKDGARLVHYNRGTTSDIVGMDVTMTGGDLIITSKSDGSAFSSIDVNTVNISGGEVTLTGHSGTAWDNAAYIGAYKGLTVSGADTVINMKENSELFGGGAIGVQLKGGTINMLGTTTSSATSAGPFGGNAAHIMFGGNGANAIDGAAIVVGDGTAANYGAMSLGNKIDMKSGSITVKKNSQLLLQPDAAALAANYTGTLSTIFAMADGTLTVEKDGKLYAPQVAFTQDGGTVTVNGQFRGGKPSDSINFSQPANNKSSYTMTGGELTVSGDMQVGKLSIKGGTVNVSADTSTNWGSSAPLLGGYGAVDNITEITGATAKVTLGNHGLFFAGVNGDSTANAGSWANGQLNISNGAKLFFDGDTSGNKGGILYAASSDGYTDPKPDVQGNYAVTLNISGADTTVTVNEGKEGYILARETNLTDGALLDVKGKLVVAGKANKDDANILDGINSTDSGFKQGGVFNLDGGTVNVGTNGLLDFVTGDVDLKAGGDGVLNSNLVLKDAAGTVKGTTYAKNLTVTGALTVTGGLDVTASGLANVNNGGSLVVSGTTKVAKANGIVVGDGSTKGSLSITKDSLFTQNTTSGKLDKNTGIVDGGISLSGTNGSNGTLIIEGFKGITVDATTFGNIFKSGSTTELAQVSNSSLIIGSYEGSNVILKDAIMQGASANVGGDKDAAAPEQLNITKPTVTAHITAPSVTTPSGNLALAPSGIMDLDANAAASGVSPTTKVDTFTNPGTTTVANGASLQVTDTADLTGGTTTVNTGSSFVAAETVMGTNTKLNVLNSTSDLGTLTATSGSLFVDPAYVSVDGVEGKFGAQLINGHGGIVNVGSKDKAWIDEAIIKSGAKSDASVLALKSGIDLDTAGQIYVDKDAVYDATAKKYYTDATKSTEIARVTQGAVHFGENSLLIVDAASFSGSTAALQMSGSNNTLTTSNTAGEASKLHIYGGKAGDTVKVVSGATGIDDSGAKGWTGENISFSSALLTLDTIEVGTGTQYGVKAKGVNATDTFNKLSGEMGGLANAMVGQVGIQVDHPNAGIRFMSRALDDRHIGRNNTTEAAATIEGAAQLAVVGAAPAMTVAAVQSGASAVTTRTSFASPLMDSTKAVALHKDTDGALSVDSGLSAGNGMKNGFGLWIMPLYQSNSAWGMKANGFKGGYKSDLGGVALGADYTFNDMFRLGLAFNIGGGYAESNGDFNKTENSFNFWGINAYGGWSMNNFGITADVGYTGNYNKMEQELPSAMGMADIKSDVTSSAWTAGLRGEYKFATEALDIIPHVGVRYTGLTTDEYKAKSGGDTVFKVDQSFQSIWTFPIGVTLAKEIETGSGWIIRPQVDLGITPATGDVKAKSKVRIPGVDSQAEMKMQVVDYMSYDGGVGLEMKKDNISFGINYNIQASEHRTGHGVFGTFRYEF